MKFVQLLFLLLGVLWGAAYGIVQQFIFKLYQIDRKRLLFLSFLCRVTYCVATALLVKVFWHYSIFDVQMGYSLYLGFVFTFIGFAMREGFFQSQEKIMQKDWHVD